MTNTDAKQLVQRAINRGWIHRPAKPVKLEYSKTRAKNLANGLTARGTVRKYKPYANVHK
jgi:hypothetical protein